MCMSEIDFGGGVILEAIKETYVLKQMSSLQEIVMGI